jgi:hypothetical protein
LRAAIDMVGDDATVDLPDHHRLPHPR